MNDDIASPESETNTQGGAEKTIDLQTANTELERKLAHLEEGINSRDTELAALKKSLADTVARYRTAALAAAPGVPAELVRGETVEEIETSLSAARDIVAGVRQQIDAEIAARTVPAGAPQRTPPDLSTLSPAQKIAHAIARMRL